ncbi:sensor of ECF-type sigma factor [Polaribacter sp. R77954]|uniref:sensor of ECF-type sigma factor n=1 Tax=Polaribacter sp. R77954 TaxID=3093870 RepID=UPI0037CC02E6
MKKIISFTCIILFFTHSIQSQRGKESWEKIKALKIAYLTEQLNLTSAEAEKFWPVYNAYNQEQNAIRGHYKSTLRKTIKKEAIDSITENAAKKLIDLKLQTDKELYTSHKKFIEKITNVIPYKLIIKLQIAEMEFGRKLMRKYKRKEPNPKD